MKIDKSEYKNCFIFLFILFCFFLNGFCGTLYVNTPKGTPVLLFDNRDWLRQWTPAEQAYIDSDLAVTYPSAILLEEPDRYYNCFSYCWNVSEGGPKDFMDGNREGFYRTDGSYIQEDSDVKGEKVHYYGGDHGANETTINDVYISKWGGYGLYKHARTMCPFHDNNFIVYYYSRFIREISNKSYINGDDIKVASHSTLTAGNNTIVNSGAKVRFVSREAMNIQSGFTVQNGAQFSAEIW
jgi:hypothetical protein